MTREDERSALRADHLRKLAAQLQRTPAEEKRRQHALKQLREKYGETQLQPLAGGARMNVRGIPSGWQALDDLLTGETDEKSHSVPGTGVGWPRGRIIELFGQPGAGKSTLSLHAVKAVQQVGGVAFYIDAEHSLDPKYAANLGVDLQKLLISQPDSAEQVIDLAAETVKTKAVDLIVVDSVAALEPEDEEESSIRKQHVALQARLMSRGLRKLTPLVSRNQLIFIFVNQIRTRIGVRFGNPSTTPGGQALKFYASIRIDVTKVQTLKKGATVIGARTRLRTVKNKCAPPFRDLYFDLRPNIGIAKVYGDSGFVVEDSDE